jgi:hypothetical protein
LTGTQTQAFGDAKEQHRNRDSCIAEDLLGSSPTQDNFFLSMKFSALLLYPEVWCKNLVQLDRLYMGKH